MRYETMLALRYLGARRRQTFISFISVVSIVGVAVGVAALILALSGQTGLHEEILARILGANAHVTIFAPPGGVIEDPEKLEAALRDVRSEEHTSELQSLRHLVCRL